MSRKLEQAEREAEQAKAELEELKLTWKGLEKDKVLLYTELPNFAILKIHMDHGVLPPSSIKLHGNRKLDNFTEFL